MSTHDSGEGAILFERVAREPRLSDKVADDMLRTIVSRRLRPGDPLPSERELGEQFGVSRTVIREAVRSLAAKGVIDVRSGSGLRVAAVDPATVTESMSLFLRGSSFDYLKVHEVRAMLEVQMAGVAAEQATEDDLDELRRIEQRFETLLDDVHAAAVADVEFHRTIARCTQNELYLVLLDAIGDALIEIRRENLAAGSGQAAIAAHRTILERIEAHDVEGARRAMGSHLESVESWWRRSHQTDAPPGL